MPRILHLLPHAGGGVGTVLRAYLKAEHQSSQNQHAVMTLESLNAPTQQCLNQLQIPWKESATHSLIHEQIEKADLVMIHWWNHPLLMQLLFAGLPPSRLLFWSHVNGYHVPQSFIPEIFDLADRFIFASHASMQAPVVQALNAENKAKLKVIPSCAGVPTGAENYCSKSRPFQAGYIGTVEAAKMHPDFLQLCSRANLKQSFIVAGGPAHQELQVQAEQLNCAKQFEILGPVIPAFPLFQKLHALAYPLVPEHYGTGEQVLIEAMAFGSVPVVLSNPPEKALIRHMETGIVAESPKAFSEALKFLEQSPRERERMARAGHAYVMEYCPIEKTQSAFQDLFDEALSIYPQSHRLQLPEIPGIQSGSPFHLYVSSCGQGSEKETALHLYQGEKFERQNLPDSFTYLTRGAPAHYLNLLGEDLALKTLCQAAGLFNLN